ncbi:putative chitin binding protein [Aspergillus steynii IBT 23096]|uniref:Putative chitin binding protein n=1 Tax=Aspergillus steynii IBT 23096 TaxID=1392250 RepID=A0A2I2G639_9EURO|nr:putative chitin binding protein [Aspergillus steynii IBT 23096]PLB48340.1 putative chitin binding protein [Aspergillus steynii IBT 23096]
MKTTGSIMALAGLVSMAHGHGFVTSPKPRMPGSAMESACGQQVKTNQEADNYGNIQGELQVASGQDDYDDAKCDIWLCKGYKFADNKDNIYSYKAGQKIDFEVDIRAPHTGVANVSVVDTSSHSVIGSPLKSWDEYASTSTGVKDTETSFSITMPDDLGDKCTEAGACVLQWYWFAESIDQTYESCVDFTLGGSGSGSGSSGSGSSSSAASGAASTTAPVAITTTPSTGNQVVSSAAPTTLATSAKQAATTEAAPAASTTAAASDSSVTGIPKDGSAEEQLTFVASLFKSLLEYAN